MLFRSRHAFLAHPPPSLDSEHASVLLHSALGFKGCSSQPQPKGKILIGPSQSWVSKPFVGDVCRYGHMAYFGPKRLERTSAGDSWDSYKDVKER